MANSPSMARILRLSGAPIMSQKAALPAAVAIPMPEGPPLTSLVTSVVSAWPARYLMPRILAWAIKGWSSRLFCSNRFFNAPDPRRNPKASMDSMAISGST